MKKYLLSTTCLMLLLFWPTQAQEIVTTTLTPDVLAPPLPPVPARFSTISETNYINELALRGFRLETQGLLIESLNGSTVYADLNSDVAFNPASVIKVATSLAALSRFGPEHRFQTAVYSTGVLNRKTRVLKGNLVVVSDGDPNLNSTDITKLARQVIRSGIAHVSGSVLVSGPFSYGSYYTTDRAIKGLATAMRRLGIRVTGGVKKSDAPAPGAAQTQVASLTSNTLADILFYQNAYSSNPIAERLGNTLGGPTAVERFLVEHVGIPAAEISIERTSGLNINRITARGTVDVFRQLVQYLEKHDMHPQDVLPVAGIDVGTLRSRFRTDAYRGAVVAKTGTLPVTDGGVSTLAGIAYTRDNGPVIFAIFNTKGNVSRFRQLQDGLLKGFLTEFGAMAPVSATSRKSNN
jgi:D-alanyl-D-alanine carboxypeptidase/D-alanyl-D-alanine-endopeptidase (penicillin-binding protein 4)